MSVVEIAEAVEKGIYDEGMHSVVEILQSEMNTVQLIAAGRSDLGYNNPDEDDYNTDFSSTKNAQTSREQHEKGVFGEAVVAKHHSDDYSIHSLDDELTRCGDSGIDLTDGANVDVKTVDWGYSTGHTPLLKVKAHVHEEKITRLKDDDDELDSLYYYLAERVNTDTARLIGFIDARVFDDEADFAEEGDGHLEWTAQTDTYYCEPESLWLSYRDD